MPRLSGVLDFAYEGQGLLAGAQMAAKKAPLGNAQRTFAELEAELERRTAERDDALARETAAAEVLQIINSSPGDLAPVFEAILEKAMRLCDAAFGELDTHDGQRFLTAATRGVPAAYAKYRRSNPSTPRPGSFGTLVLEGQRIIHI